MRPILRVVPTLDDRALDGAEATRLLVEMKWSVGHSSLEDYQ
jgi:hypothetical protein